ncbi:hypothetical protein MBOU_43920 [Mycobacterium bourgelatii]|uniref:O-acyltransferase WSD1 C-terminal domain-containing protein n=1 Tax=Mycobacterium bourgelatii TaxID=1273442 RepID=A0A7I9YUH4_MYCBU|nr:hypothetical protein MBOU_43920 [Mycobacterium bourgelatii]
MAACGINITVWGYVDQLNISVIADDAALADPHEASDAMVQRRSAKYVLPRNNRVI